MITILAIGKKHESWISPGLERYEKRLKAPWNLQWILLPHSSLEGDRARQEESQRLLSRIDTTNFVLLLDERGKSLDSPAFSAMFERLQVQSKRIVVVIGGAYGVNDELMKRTDVTVSLSAMVFPHQIVRLLLAEQVYRAQSIAAGTRYHHM